MAKDKCVSVRGDVKKIFDKNLAKAVCEKMKSTIEAMVNKTKGLVVDKNCKDGWALNATILSLDVDDPGNPKTMEVKVQIAGMALNQSASTINATGNGKMSGVRVKKIEDDATTLVSDVVEDLMKSKVIPALTR